jgi:hypothetical protein
MTSNTPSEAFYNGMFNIYGITRASLDSGDWVYAGGNWSAARINYFRLIFGDDAEFPEEEEKCVCGHNIIHNGYLKNKKNNQYVVLGSECITKFHKDRTCEECGVVHRNRKDNKCNICRLKCSVKGCNAPHSNKQELLCKYHTENRRWFPKENKWRYLKGKKCDDCEELIPPKPEYKTRCKKCYYQFTRLDQ